MVSPLRSTALRPPRPTDAPTRDPLTAVPEPPPRPAAPRRPHLRRLRLLGAAVFGGLCVHAAIPTLDLAVPALVAWVPALVLARGLRWRHRLALGWLLGAVADLVTFSFIAFTMEHMTNLPGPVGVALVALYALWHGLLAGLFLALAEPARRAAERRLAGAGPLAVAACYAAVDWLFPQVFPLSIGHSFWQVGPVASIAALTGVSGLAFLALLVNASLADAWVHRRARRLLLPGVALLALLGFGVAWYTHVHAVTPTDTLRVAIVQPNYTLEEKKRAAGRIAPEDGGFPGQGGWQRARFLERLDATLRAIPPDRFDLIVASEGAFPGLWRVDADRYRDGGPIPSDVVPTRVVQRAIAEGPRTHAIIGGLRRGPDGRTRNAAVHLGPDGAIRGHYDKQTLMAFGEYLPGRELFPDLAAKVQGIADFAAGDAACAFHVGDVTVACGVCYETVFAVSTRDDLGSASVLVNLTIDTWFGTTNAPRAHLMLHTVRAAELGVPLIRSALTGVSALVGPDGQVEASLPLDAAGVLEVDVPLRPLATPFRAVGPVFAWLCVALLLGLLFDAFLRRRELLLPAVVPPAVHRVAARSPHEASADREPSADTGSDDAHR